MFSCLSKDHFRHPNNDNERISTEEWIDEAVEDLGKVNSHVNSNLDDSRSRMKNYYKASPTPQIYKSDTRYSSTNSEDVLLDQANTGSIVVSNEQGNVLRHH